MTDRKRPFILDVDTGIDDAAAIALAVNSPEIELLAVSTVAGNVDVTHTTDNTLRVLDWLSAGDVPVHRGASRPLTRTPRHATEVHGGNGLGDADFPPARAGIGKDRGPAAIIRLAMAQPGEITLVCVGPLTNLAIALNVEPSLTSLLKRVVIMGGSFFNPGNVTPYAEFNAFVDPEAAAQVFAAPFAEITAVGLDASHQALLSRTDWEAAGRSESPTAQLLAAVYGASFTARGKSDCYLHDPLALAIAIDPAFATYESGAVTVELSEEKRGKTTLDTTGSGVNVASEIDAERFHRTMLERLSVGELGRIGR